MSISNSGASKVYRSMFSVKAWFAIHGKQFGVRVSIVPCNVPLLFSRPVPGSLCMCYDVAKQQVGLSSLNLQELPLLTSPTGHPALLVSDFGKNPLLEELPEFSPEAVHIPAFEAYMSASQAFFQAIVFSKEIIERNSVIAGITTQLEWSKFYRVVEVSKSIT